MNTNNPDTAKPAASQGATLTASFATRREAEMTIERLVQEFEIERTAIFVAADGDHNSVGETRAGSDTKAGEPTTERRADAPTEGRILVSVDFEDRDKVARVREAFAEFHAVAVGDR